ncbi:MAG: regulatory protein RecX [Eubacteriales bacterium]|nr:regulatory protein RecX [Eubacteriales bacterium]
MTYDMQKRAKLRCMHLLEKRDYTEKQLRDKLRVGKTEYTPEVIDGAIAYVKSCRYIDDARYACQYVECMKDRKSRRQIEQELFQRGVSREYVESAFEQTETVPEDGLIEKWLEKKHYCQETADMKEVRRMYAFLARKGFSGEAISRALKKGTSEDIGF